MALLHYTAPPVMGGVESILGAHARFLRSAGHDVLVVCGRGAGSVVPELDSRHPEVEALAVALAAGEGRFQDFEGLRARIRASLRPLLADRDLVIVHNVLTMPFNLPAAAALGDLGRPLLAWTHDLAWTNPRHRDWVRPGPPYDLLHHPLPGARYVAISELRRDELAATLGLASGEIEVVPNGIDGAGFLGLSAATTRLLATAGCAGADPLLLVPVRITPRKRIEVAIEAAALLARRLPGLRMVVSGPLGAHSPANETYAAYLEDQARRLGVGQRVAFLHRLGGPAGEHPVADGQMAELYRAADAVLLPSESEGFGLPVLEAGLARVPLVCPDLPVLREAGGDGLHAYPPGSSAAAVAAEVERALDSSPARLRSRVRHRYDWAAVGPRLLALVEAGDG